MPVTTFEFEKGKIFAAGLFWLPLGASKDPKTQIREMAKADGFDFAIQAYGHTPQAGFASAKDGFKYGWMSVAAVINKHFQEHNADFRDILCAVPVPDQTGRWIFFSTRNNVIQTDTGDVIGTEDMVQSEMMNAFSIGQWDKVIAPPHWHFGNSEEMTFADFLPKDGKGRVQYHKWWTVGSVGGNLLPSLKRAAMPLLLIVSFLSVMAFGYSWYTKKKLSDEAARMARELEEISQAEKPLVPPPHPWAQMPLADDFVRACQAAIERVPLAPGGWTLISAGCSGSTISASWNRPEWLSINHIKTEFPGANVADDGNSAQWSAEIPLSSVRRDESVAELSSAMEIRDRMISLGQTSGLKISLTNEPPPPEPPPGVKPKELPPDWQTKRFQINTGINPNSVVREINGKGVRVEALTMLVKAAAIEWEIKGLNYAK